MAVTGVSESESESERAILTIAAAGWVSSSESEETPGCTGRARRMGTGEAESSVIVSELELPTLTIGRTVPGEAVDASEVTTSTLVMGRTTLVWLEVGDSSEEWVDTGTALLTTIGDAAVSSESEVEEKVTVLLDTLVIGLVGAMEEATEESEE